MDEDEDRDRDWDRDRDRDRDREQQQHYKPVTTLIPTSPFESWIWHALMALFAIGFLAWAAAVWRATSLVETQQIKMDQMQRDISHLENELDAHQNMNAHNGAAVQNAETRRDLTALTNLTDRRLTEVERRLQALTDREYGARGDDGTPRRQR